MLFSVKKIQNIFLRPLFSRGFFFILIFLFIEGCISSNPKYVTKETKSKKVEKNFKPKVNRFSSAAEEELKTDDKKINVHEVASRFDSNSEVNSNTKNSAIETQKMMDVILSYLGTPYKFGGETKSGIDCSAFTQEVFRQSTSISLPRSTSEQIKIGEDTPKENLQFGDLLFFNTTGVNPSHVGIFIGDNMFAHASEAYGVTISSFESSYYKKHFTQAKRVANN